MEEYTVHDMNERKYGNGVLKLSYITRKFALNFAPSETFKAFKIGIKKASFAGNELINPRNEKALIIFG